jgi:hypothetical protein
MSAICVGLCGACGLEVRLRKDGSLGKHPPGTGTAACAGYGGRPERVLPLTFRRWLSTQRNRRGHGRDLCVGRIARLAERVPGDWATAEDFAAVLGSRLNDRWAIYLEEAAEEHRAVAAAGDAA